MKKTGRLFYFLLAMLAVSLFACKSETTQPSEKFMEAYIEMRVATEHFGSRPEAGLARRDILKKYGFTAQSFSAEADRLRQNYGLWQEYEKRVVERLDTLVLSKQKKKDQSIEAKEEHAKDTKKGK